MSSDFTIQIKNLSKCYQIYDKPRHRLMQMLSRGRKQYYREFWALHDISFEIERGQTIGILGKNGAGKSTLLQLLCGTLAPSTGSINIHGRIAALLELGAGFNPEFTGIENVYMNGQILGLTKEKIDSKIEDIKSFADIGDFFYEPVKTYSSGMFARLAFSVAVNVEPDILIVDEALSVGDSWFQHKSMARMKALMHQGCTVLFVSHSIESVRALCKKAIWLEQGRIRSYGDVTAVTNEYMNEVFVERNRITLDTNYVTEKSKAFKIGKSSDDSNDTKLDDHDNTPILNAAKNLDGHTALSVNSVKLINSSNSSVNKFNQGEKFTLEFDLTFFTDLKDISVGFLIKDQFSQELTGESVFNTYRHGLSFNAGQQVKFRFSSSMLLRGGQSYSVALLVNHVSSWDRSDNISIYVDDIAAVFDVISDPENPMWFKFKQDFKLELVHE